MKDHSDWWSILNENFHGPNIKPTGLDIDQRNFQIAALDIAHVSFADITRRFGNAVRASRGDASTGREQACYRSSGKERTVFLIFEFGEDQSSFYLFDGGASWKGKEFCKTSNDVSERLATASGLRLGLMHDQVQAILGKPDAIVGERVIYSRIIRRKSSPERFERQRREYPVSLDDKEAHEMFDYYTTDTYVEVRFDNSRLAYVVTSISGEE